MNMQTRGTLSGLITLHDVLEEIVGDMPGDILTRWHNSHVHHLKDISVLDDAYQKQKAVSAASAPKAKPVSRNLNNFERRSYDMDSLEEQLLNSN